MVDPVLLDEHLHCPAEALRLGAVELDAAGRLGGGEVAEPAGLEVPVDESAGSDHLAHVESGAVFAAEGAKRGVGDAGHRRQHDRRPDLEGADAGSGELARGGGRHIGVDLGAQTHGHKARRTT